MIGLIITFSIIAAVTIGGGYAMIPLIQEQAVNLNKWISAKEFVDILAISQITPGAIAINSATFIGFKTYFLMGAISASIGLVLPSVLFIFFIAPLLKKYEQNRWRTHIFSGIKPVVTALIASAVIMLMQSVFIQSEAVNIQAVLIASVAFIVLRVVKIKPFFVLLGCASLGLVIGSY